MILYYFLSLLVIFDICNAYFLNATGATFPVSIYSEATFAYRFVSPDDQLYYFGSGSTTGKCNILGYWHTGNTDSTTWAPSSSVKQMDTNICTDKCTVTLCGNDSSKYPRFDKSTRHPLVHFAGSDAPLADSDYKAFPDIQMFPAVAGAVVPIYNIPEITSIGGTLILSRSTITNIFLGKIVVWNDPAILADQASSPAVQTALANVNQPIKVCVRTDSSGTTSIFSTTLANFDPEGAESFGVSVTSSQTPKWCGPKTDEIQIITASNCSSKSPLKTISLAVIKTDFTVGTVSFNCDDSATTVKTAFNAVYGSENIIVSRTASAGNTSYTFSIGYWGSSVTTKNWYEPSVISTGYASVAISTLQEGGFWNSHYNSSAYSVTAETQSIFVRNTSASWKFRIINQNSNAGATASGEVDVSLPNMLTQIKNVLKTIAPGLVTAVKLVPHGRSDWVEYQLSFNTSKPNPQKPKVFGVSTDSSHMAFVAISTLLHASNYPFFYDSSHPQGFGNSGKYTCYKHNGFMRPWAYYTGSGNLGVIAEVLSQKYSIGYSVLQDAKQLQIASAGMINRAGNVVYATSDSLAFAVMEKGGNLNSRFIADLSDGASSRAWPLAGYTYFVIRGTDHLGTCPQRTAAMTFLYDFYRSKTVQQIAARLGFTTLPNFIRDLIVNRLLDTAMCKDGSYALASYRRLKTPLLATASISSTLSTYISSYYNIDSNTQWDLGATTTSTQVWSSFLSAPSSYVGTFTMFSSRSLKEQKFKDASFSANFITTAFAHLAVVPIYHLDTYIAKAGTSKPLQLTSEILGGIYAGTIKYWDDAKIRAANSATQAYLPHSRIKVVVRSSPNDDTEIFARFLSLRSQEFASAYGLQRGVGTNSLNYLSVLDKNYSVSATDNYNVDAKVTFYDNSIGYYRLVGSPNALVALYCADAVCSSPVTPSNPNSILKCQDDLNTVVEVPSARLQSFDLMVSNRTDCYPIVGTVDYTVPASIDSTCSSGSAGIAHKRVQFSSWLYSGPIMNQPLVQMGAAGAPNDLRSDAYRQICDIQCTAYLGYDYCSYRDCSWKAGDYSQLVSACKSSSVTRTVTYDLIDPSNDCIKNPKTVPPSSISIKCDYVPSDSAMGIAGYFLSALGIAISSGWLVYGIYMREDKRMAKNQPVYVYIFLTGSIILNASIISFIGKNTGTKCLCEQWVFNIALTLLFGPIVMKLYTIDRLNRNPQLGKILLANTRVIQEVAGLLVLDFILLGIFTGLNSPAPITVKVTYQSVLQDVSDVKCNTGIDNYLYLVVVGYKAIVFFIGIVKAICTWHVTSEISEAKQFAVAVSLGGITYLVGVFLGLGGGDSVTIKTVATFICATLSVTMIMAPKFIKPIRKRKKTSNDNPEYDKMGNVQTIDVQPINTIGSSSPTRGSASPYKASIGKVPTVDNRRSSDDFARKGNSERVQEKKDDEISAQGARNRVYAAPLDEVTEL